MTPPETAASPWRGRPSGRGRPEGEDGKGASAARRGGANAADRVAGRVAGHGSEAEARERERGGLTAPGVPRSRTAQVTRRHSGSRSPFLRKRSAMWGCRPRPGSGPHRASLGSRCRSAQRAGDRRPPSRSGRTVGGGRGRPAGPRPGPARCGRVRPARRADAGNLIAKPIAGIERRRTGRGTERSGKRTQRIERSGGRFGATASTRQPFGVRAFAESPAGARGEEAPDRSTRQANRPQQRPHEPTAVTDRSNRQAIRREPRHWH